MGYTKVPPNGLVIYCGTIVTDEGKEKKVNTDFEPFKPINTSLYLCDNKFHTEALTALLADDNRFGFIVMDGNGALFGTLQGNTRDVLHKFAWRSDTTMCEKWLKLLCNSSSQTISPTSRG